jgi:hypothetical protein
LVGRGVIDRVALGPGRNYQKGQALAVNADAAYSYLSDTIGSTRMARRVGK